MIFAEHFASLKQHVGQLHRSRHQVVVGVSHAINKYINRYTQISYSSGLQHNFSYKPLIRVCLGQVRLDDPSIQWFFKKYTKIMNNCLCSMVSHGRGEFLAQYRLSSSFRLTSHTFLEHFLLSGGAAWHHFYIPQKEKKKTLSNLNASQSPTETDVFGAFHVWKGTKARPSRRGASTWENHVSVPVVTSHSADVKSCVCLTRAEVAKE